MRCGRVAGLGWLTPVRGPAGRVWVWRLDFPLLSRSEMGTRARGGRQGGTL